MHTMTQPTKDIRSTVAQAYARAVTAPTSGSSCCGGASCGSATLQSPTAVLAGYETDELSDLPAAAIEKSFGCGNPLAFSEVKPGETVLDLGSGAGIDLLIAAKKVGPTGRVIGVDMTDAMIEKARTNIAASGHANVEVRKGYIEELPVEDGSVDWVISNCVINLSPDKPAVFREIARVLKPGGRIRVSDMVVESLPDEVRDNEVIYAGCIGGAISERDYLAGLEAAGLVDAQAAERLVYSGDQLAFLLGDGAHGDSANASCCGVGPLTGVDVNAVARSMEGQVASVLFTARKPS